MKWTTAEILEELRQEAQGFRRRAEFCAEKAQGTGYISEDYARLRGKHSAYAHAAELLENTIERIEATEDQADG